MKGANKMKWRTLCIIWVVMLGMETTIKQARAHVDNNVNTGEESVNSRKTKLLKSVSMTTLSESGTNTSDSTSVSQYPDLDNSEELMPPEWQSFCNTSYRFVSGSNFTSQWAMFAECRLTAGNYWSLQGYRTWMEANENRLQRHIPNGRILHYAVELKCTKGGRVSIPYPARAMNLWYLTVDNCTILDNLLEYNSTENSTNILAVLELTNSILEIDTNQFFESVMNFINASRQFHCGGEQLERYVYRNIKMEFVNLPDMDATETHSEGGTAEPNKRSKSQTHQRGEANQTPTLLENHGLPSFNHQGQSSINKHELTSLDNHAETSMENHDLNVLDMLNLDKHVQAHIDGIQSPNRNHPAPISESSISNSAARLGQENQEIQYICQFNRMRYFDESISDILSKQHFQFLDEHSRYPVLEYYNISHSKIGEMSPHLLQWRRYFPKMKYMDLSHNKITYFATFADNGLTSDPPGVLDLRHNNITTLTTQDLDALQFQSRTVFVDIRDNPFVCDCKLTDALHIMKNQSAGVFKKYAYLKNLKCNKPNHLSGTMISTLDINFCEDLEIIVSTVPIIIMSIIIAFLMATVVVIIRYRKEIVILAFTRWNISLPCRQLEQNGDKKYDAFIAYSEHDFNWVRQMLLPRLEGQDNGQGQRNEQMFKLCLHHRDFPVGGSITENILDKINESRHTILILSNNFLQSKWCQYEFKQAFTQSLLEKKKHLIMILLEELDRKFIGPEMKRCLKTFTYAKIDDRLFWDKIIFALSDKKNGGKKLINNEEIIENNNKLENLNINVQNKIENENIVGNVQFNDIINENRDMNMQNNQKADRIVVLDMPNNYVDNEDGNMHNDQIVNENFELNIQQLLKNYNENDENIIKPQNEGEEMHVLKQARIEFGDNRNGEAQDFIQDGIWII